MLINAIDNCKILDPACGSGAFPMGILHKLVHILHKLDPNNEKWKERQLEKAQTIDDVTIREQLIDDIETAFAGNELDYGRKLYLIENCIYGVDIQPIATQISKLRFFISLVVDQDVDKNKDNFGVRPLPNLETKFVAANTLIGVEKPKEQGDLFDNKEVEALEEELKKVRHRLFSAKTPKTKRELREEDKTLREKMSDLLIKGGWRNETARQLAGWDPYDQNAGSPFFNAEWMFGVRDGFDVVIGNPPYVQIQKFARTQLQKDLENEDYQTFFKTGDIYCLFYERGLELAKPITGLLCYITSNKWMRSGYGDKLRGYFASKNPIRLLDFGDFKVFENATVDTNILLIANHDNKQRLQACHFEKDYKKGDEISEYFVNNEVELKNLSNNTWFIGTSAEIALKAKIEAVGKPLKEWNVKINRGVLTGLNEAFIINQATRDRLVVEDPKSVEIIKPILRGRDIQRYGYEWAGLYLLQTGYDLNIPKLYPAIYEHLKQFEEKAIKRDDKGKNWWNLRACVFYDDFEKEKVVWIELVNDGRFAYVEPDIYTEATTFLMTFEHPKYLVGLMNSKIVNWYFDSICGESGVGTNRWKKFYVEAIPLPILTPTTQTLSKRIEFNVDRILSAKKANLKADTAVFEAEIDKLVFELYDLTPEEQEIVLKS
ncbi:MAG: Eco57I restriction-modification methylase domain-containing protein [Nitrospirae bacterium]|nr:Eco57I restriction-modification methylase domain-containing protein [Nitrospirota bacterium]